VRQIYANPQTQAQLRQALASMGGVAGDLAALEAVAVTADAEFGTDNVLVETDGTVRKLSGTTILTANVVTEASAAASSGLVMQSAGADKTISATATVAANLVTEASAAASSGLLMQSAGADRTVSATAILTANVATAAAGFGVDNSLILADGTDKGIKASTIIESDLTTAFSDIVNNTTAIGLNAAAIIVNAGAITAIEADYVSAASPFGTDNLVLRSNGTVRDSQVSTVSIADSGLLTVEFTGATIRDPAFVILDSALNTLFELRPYDTGNDNLGMGPNALAAVTTGTDNTCIGSGAGAGITTGAFHVCIGSNAGSSLTGPAVSCLFIGTAAGLNATGTNNVGVGTSACRGASGFSGTNNVCIGGTTGGALTTGTNNMLFGTGAGNAISTGASNTCVGTFSGETLSTASFSVFIGASAGRYATGALNIGIGVNGIRGTDGSFTGADNVGIGFNTGLVLTSGARNVLMGRSAGDTITSGSNNTCIGYETAGAFTTGSNSVFIGTDAGDNASQLTSADNSIAIGNATYTTASNQIMIGNTSITQTLLRGTVDVVRSTNACRLNVYNTAAADPPGTSFELAALRWDSNVAKVGTHKGAGGGTARALALETDGVVRLTLNADGTMTLDTWANLPTTEPSAGAAGTMWLDASDANSAILKVTTS
jgi:hypothetical protein